MNEVDSIPVSTFDLRTADMFYHPEGDCLEALAYHDVDVYPINLFTLWPLSRTCFIAGSLRLAPLAV